MQKTPKEIKSKLFIFKNYFGTYCYSISDDHSIWIERIYTKWIVKIIKCYEDVIHSEQYSLEYIIDNIDDILEKLISEDFINWEINETNKFIDNNKKYLEFIQKVKNEKRST